MKRARLFEEPNEPKGSRSDLKAGGGRQPPSPSQHYLWCLGGGPADGAGVTGGRLHLPLDLAGDAVLHKAKDLIGRLGAKRVGIDSLTALLTKFLAVFIGLMSKDLPLTFLRDAWPEVEIG